MRFYKLPFGINPLKQNATKEHSLLILFPNISIQMNHLQIVSMAWLYDCVLDESERLSKPGVDIKSLSKMRNP
jgi:hypothetical protein